MITDDHNVIDNIAKWPVIMIIFDYFMITFCFFTKINLKNGLKLMLFVQ